MILGAIGAQKKISDVIGKFETMVKDLEECANKLHGCMATNKDRIKEIELENLTYESNAKRALVVRDRLLKIVA
jgi:hypothetical protein